MLQFFPRNLALELGEGEQYIQGQAPHRTGGVELLSDVDEGDAASIQRIFELVSIPHSRFTMLRAGRAGRTITPFSSSRKKFRILKRGRP